MRTLSYSTGWVATRRGILEHLTDGRLTLNEWTAFLILLMRADIQTGICLISAKSLCSLMRGGLTQKQCERVLKTLVEKGYLKSGFQRGGSKDYPVLINKFEPSVGPNKGKIVDVDASPSAQEPVYISAEAMPKHTNVTNNVTTREITGGQNGGVFSLSDRDNSGVSQVAPVVKTNFRWSNRGQSGGQNKETSLIETPTLEVSSEEVGGQSGGQTGDFVKYLTTNKTNTTTTPEVVVDQQVGEQVENVVTLLYKKLAEKEVPTRIPAKWNSKLSVAINEYGYQTLTTMLNYCAGTQFWKAKFKTNSLPVQTFLKSLDTIYAQAESQKPVPSRLTSPRLSEVQVAERVAADYEAWKASCTGCGGSGVRFNDYLKRDATCGDCTAKKAEFRALYN